MFEICLDINLMSYSFWLTHTKHVCKIGKLLAEIAYYSS